MKYIYFLSYTHITKINHGAGNAQVTRNKKIKSLDDIRAIEKDLMELNNFDYCVINNWKRMKKKMK